MQRTPSTSIILMSCPSIQKKKAANADVFTMRSRYVFPGWNGSVAFSLKPTADVTADGLVPATGPRYVAFFAK